MVYRQYYQKSFEELKSEFKVGEMHEVQGDKMVVVEVKPAPPAINFASFPSVVFDIVEKNPYGSN